MTILVDMDNVLENMGEAWVERINARYGTDVKYDNISDWDIAKFFPTLTREMVFSPLSESDFWENNVKPIDGAVETLKRLIGEGNDVYVVTASGFQTLYDKVTLCLFRWFPFLTVDNIVITQNKQIISGDVLIDDAPHNLIGGNYKGILFDAPHNRSFDEKSAGFVRARSWNEIYLILNKM